MKRVIFLLALLLGGCSTAPQRTLPPVVDGTQPRTAPPEAADSVERPDRVEVPVPPPAPSGGAVVALLDRADA